MNISIRKKIILNFSAAVIITALSMLLLAGFGASTMIIEKDKTDESILASSKLQPQSSFLPQLKALQVRRKNCMQV